MGRVDKDRLGRLLLTAGLKYILFTPLFIMLRRSFKEAAEQFTDVSEDVAKTITVTPLQQFANIAILKTTAYGLTAVSVL
jgi:hypothetical protein